MINLENALGFKKLFSALKSNNLDFRERNFSLIHLKKVIIYLILQ